MKRLATGILACNHHWLISATVTYVLIPGKLLRRSEFFDGRENAMG
jgi:hypothetical protein